MNCCGVDLLNMEEFLLLHDVPIFSARPANQLFDAPGHREPMLSVCAIEQGFDELFDRASDSERGIVTILAFRLRHAAMKLECKPPPWFN